MSNTVKGSRPWLCEYLVQCLEPESKQPVLHGKYAQVLTVNASSREMVVYDGEYSAQALLTQEAANELANDGSGISVQGLLGRTLIPVDVVLVQELNLVPPSITIIIKKMKVFRDSMSHRPVRDPPFAADAPTVRQKLRALHLEQITMPVPELPVPGSELTEQLSSEVDLSDSPPRSVRLEPCPIPENPSVPSEGNAPCLRFADTPNSGNKKRSCANGDAPNGDEEVSTIEMDEEEHGNALPELTSSLIDQGMYRMSSPPPVPLQANCDKESPAETQQESDNCVSNLQKLPMTQFDLTEDTDDDESEIAEDKAEAEKRIDDGAMSSGDKAEDISGPAAAEDDVDATMKDTANGRVVDEDTVRKNKPNGTTTDDVGMGTVQKSNGSLGNGDVDMRENSKGMEDMIVSESPECGNPVENKESSTIIEETATEKPSMENGETQKERERKEKQTEVVQKKSPGLLIEDQDLIAKVSDVVDDALKLLVGMAEVDGPWNIKA